MSDNTFDNFVRNKLRDHQSPVPQGLWEKIELKKDREPKGGFWLSRTALWAGMLFIVACIGFGYYFMVNNKPTVPNEQISETAAAKNNGSLSATHTDNSNNAVTDDPTANNVTNTATNANTTNTDNSNNSSEENKITNDGANNIKGTAITNGKTTGNDNTLDVNNKIVEKKRVSTGNNPSSEMDNNNDEGIYFGGRLGKKYNKTQTKRSIFSTPSGAEQNVAATATASENNFSLSRGTTAFVPNMLSVTQKEKFDLSQIRLFGIDCPTAGVPHRDDIYLEIYASPDYTMKSVDAKGNALYAKKKDSTETQMGGYTAGFRLSKSIGEYLLIKAGLQYSQINERFDLRTENERRITTVITIRTVTTPSGTDTTIRDTTTLEQIGYRVQRTYNRYRNIDIPVLLSYEFGDERLKFGLNAGVIFNIHSWQTGEALNDSLNVVSLNSKSTPIYKQNIGLGLYGGLSIIKPIGKKTEAFVEPYFRYNLSNMATGSAYTQKFNSAGINIGIRYQLKGQRRGMK